MVSPLQVLHFHGILATSSPSPWLQYDFHLYALPKEHGRLPCTKLTAHFDALQVLAAPDQPGALIARQSAGEEVARRPRDHSDSSQELIDFDVDCKSVGPLLFFFLHQMDQAASHSAGHELLVHRCRLAYHLERYAYVSNVDVHSVSHSLLLRRQLRTSST